MSGAAPPEPEGLAHERTTLAWSRTALALAALAAFEARLVAPDHLRAGAVLTVALLALSGLAWAGSIVRRRTDDPVAVRRLMAAVAWGTALVSAATALVVI